MISVIKYVRGLYARGRSKRLLKHGVSTQAVLLNVQPTGVYVDSFPQVQLQMQVFSKTGRNFVTEVCEVVDPVVLNGLQAGRWIEIKYNRENIREVILVKY